MTLPICRLCFNTTEEKDVDFIDDNIKEILQILLIKIDLKIIENPVICSTCRRRLEQNYGFKMKCVFTEKSITPFVAEHVKINLNEVRTQIIKSEETDNDKNVCRLCLKFSENDMCLNEAERTQFQKWFPEVNLNLTNFVVLCPTCYDSLQKYFIFITSRVESEQQLCNYSLDLKEENGIINLEQFQQYSRNIDQCLDEKNISLLNEELDIKCEADIEDERSMLVNCNQPQSTDAKLMENEGRLKPKPTNSSNNKIQKCSQCDYHTPFKSTLNGHILRKHTDPSKIQMNCCEHCDSKFIFKYALKRHVMQMHTDQSRVTKQKCNQCNFESKDPSNLKRHILYQHTDDSKIEIFKCDQCDYKFKYKDNLRSHVLHKHTDISETKMFKCDKCSFQSRYKRNVKIHHLTQHVQPSKVNIYRCDVCNLESRNKNNLKRHIILQHTEASKKKKKCPECDFETNHSLKHHMLWKHTDRSSDGKHKCDKCSYETKRKRSLRNHILSKHTDSSQIKLYKCDQCAYVSKVDDHLRSHISLKHRKKSD